MNETVHVLTSGLSAEMEGVGQKLNAIQDASCQRCAKVGKSPLQVAEITPYLLNHPINTAPTCIFKDAR